MHGNLVKHMCKESKKKEKLQINKMHIHVKSKYSMEYNIGSLILSNWSKVVRQSEGVQDLDMLGICDK